MAVTVKELDEVFLAKSRTRYTELEKFIDTVIKDSYKGGAVVVDLPAELSEAISYPAARKEFFARYEDWDISYTDRLTFTPPKN